MSSGITEPFCDRVENGFYTYVHTDPVRARPAMAIDAAVNVGAFDADVRREWAAVSPPFRRAEDADDGCASRNREVCRARVAADID